MFPMENEQKICYQCCSAITNLALALNLLLYHSTILNSGGGESQAPPPPPLPLYETLTAMSTAYPGHSENKVSRTAFDKQTKKKGTHLISVSKPIVFDKYNAFMVGVDKSDQLLSYHNVLQKTVKY